MLTLLLSIRCAAPEACERRKCRRLVNLGPSQGGGGNSTGSEPYPLEHPGGGERGPILEEHF